MQNEINNEPTDNAKDIDVGLHKKWSFPVKISVLNMTKSTVNWGTSFFEQW